MSEFRFLDNGLHYVTAKNVEDGNNAVLLEIAFQLKRIADKIDEERYR